MCTGATQLHLHRSSPPPTQPRYCFFCGSLKTGATGISFIIFFGFRRKEGTLTNMREEWERAVMSVPRELHKVFQTFEGLEDTLRARFADDPAGFDLRMRIKEAMLTNFYPLAQSQLRDIKHANIHPPHHPYSLQPHIWSALPQDLTELVLSKLPMRNIIALTGSSVTSPCFRRSCAERHPDLWALMRWDSASVRATVYDSSCNDWTGFDLAGFPTRNHGGRIEAYHGYEDSMYAHDRGLVCFVPTSAAPILVSNPLTGDWRTLPVLPHEHRPTLAVQLLVDETGAYEVKVVRGETDVKELIWIRTHTPENSAYCYDSRTGRWTSLETGFVFGGSGTLQQLQRKVPVVFNCEKRLFWYLSHAVSVQQPYSWAGTRDSVAVFHDACGVTELAWRGNSYIRQRTMTLGPYVYRSKAPQLVFLFATKKFLFVIGDSIVKLYGKSCQLLQLFDRETRKWRLTSDLGECEASDALCLKRAFVCELRWDAVP